MRFKSLALALGLSFMIPLVALAEFHGHGSGGLGGGPMPMPMMMLLRHVNLTADQQNQVHQLIETNMTQARPLMAQLHSIHDQIADKLLGPGAVTAADLTPLQEQASKVHQQLDQQMLATALQIRGVLTPAQLAKAADLHTKLQSLRSQMQALIGNDEPPSPAGSPD